MSEEEMTHSRTCDECGRETFKFERCHHCGDVHWTVVTDGGSEEYGERTPRRYLTNGELREQIAHTAGGDPTRYGAGSQRRLTKEDVVRVAERLRPAEDALQFNQCDLATLYERACEWAGGEYQPNAGKAWGINRDNLKRIHQALDASEPRKVVMTDGGREQGSVSQDSARWTVLDLFAGLGGFSSAFEDSGNWRVVQVEIEERFDPDIRADVLELRPKDLPDADLVLASPPCKCFSRAAAWADHFDANGTPQTPEARESITLVYHTLGLIEAISPRYWFLENPMGSKVKRYLGEPSARVTYCQYGTTYQKPTYLWGEHPPMTYRWCSRGDHCHEHGSLEDERDNRPLPRDPAERAKVPRELSESIREAVDDAFENPPPEQTTLVTDGGVDRQEHRVEHCPRCETTFTPGSGVECPACSWSMEIEAAHPAERGD